MSDLVSDDALGTHQGPPPELEELLDELLEVVSQAKSMPLSASAIINREEVLDLVEQARHALPMELLIDEARAHAAHLVERTEVVRQARNQAERIILDAEADARRVRREADDYVDRKLAAFEIVLDRTIRTVQSGRERLSAVPTLDEEPTAGGDQESGEETPFDQDLA